METLEIIKKLEDWGFDGVSLLPEETDLRVHLWCAAVTVYGIEELHIKKSDKMRKAFENSFFVLERDVVLSQDMKKEEIFALLQNLKENLAEV